MEKEVRTVPEQLGKIAQGFAEITRKMEGEKRRNQGVFNKKKS